MEKIHLIWENGYYIMLTPPSPGSSKFIWEREVSDFLVFSMLIRLRYFVGDSGNLLVYPLLIRIKYPKLLTLMRVVSEESLLRFVRNHRKSWIYNNWIKPEKILQPDLIKLLERIYSGVNEYDLTNSLDVFWEEYLRMTRLWEEYRGN